MKIEPQPKHENKVETIDGKKINCIFNCATSHRITLTQVKSDKWKFLLFIFHCWQLRLEVFKLRTLWNLYLARRKKYNKRLPMYFNYCFIIR